MNAMKWGPRAGLITFVVAAALTAHPAAGQSYLLPQTPEKGIWLEATHPEIQDSFGEEITLPSSAWFLSGRYPFTARLSGVAELPFAYGSLKGDSGSSLDGKSVFGNPYVGVEFTLNEVVSFEGGVRAPLTSADEQSFGDVVGVLGDLMRMEAFVMDVFPVSAAVNLHHTVGAGITLRGRLGATSLIWTGDDEIGESLTLMDYGAFAQIPVNRARLGAGIAGRWDLTEEEGGFSENSLHHLGLSADYAFGRFRPGIMVRVPLDEDYRDVVSASVGLYVQMTLR